MKVEEEGGGNTVEKLEELWRVVLLFFNSTVALILCHVPKHAGITTLHRQFPVQKLYLYIVDKSEPIIAYMCKEQLVGLFPSLSSVDIFT